MILTDHGDGTREPEFAGVSAAVCCASTPSKISTTSGHVVALGLPRTPYSLGGETRDVVEDIRTAGWNGDCRAPGVRAGQQLRWTEWSVRSTVSSG